MCLFATILYTCYYCHSAQDQYTIVSLVNKENEWLSDVSFKEIRENRGLVVIHIQFYVLVLFTYQAINNEHYKIKKSHILK